MKRAWTLQLPYAKPPLSMNERTHWRSKAAKVATLRRQVAELATGIGPLDHVVVTLHYVPRDARRRDADNLVPVLKAAADGLVDAGGVLDDTPELMTKHMPVIEAPDRTDPHLYLTLETTT